MSDMKVDPSKSKSDLLRKFIRILRPKDQR